MNRNYHQLTNRAQEYAVALYWRDALTLIHPTFDIIAYIKRHPDTQNPTDMGDIANGLLFGSDWIFTEHGERIA